MFIPKVGPLISAGLSGIAGTVKWWVLKIWKNFFKNPQFFFDKENDPVI